MNFVFWLGPKEYKISLGEKDRNEFKVTVGGRSFEVRAEFPGQDELLLNIEGKVYNVIVSRNTLSHSVFVNGRQFKIEKRSALKILKEDKGRLKRREIKISMPGRVVQVLAAEGDSVQEGQAVLVIEAMKMQNEMKSPQAGRVTRIHFQPGDYVEAGSILFTVE
jgi:biotin carboxyl carrier protein